MGRCCPGPEKTQRRTTGHARRWRGRSGSTGDRQRATTACEPCLSRNRAGRLLQGWRRDVCPVQARKRHGSNHALVLADCVVVLAVVATTGAKSAIHDPMQPTMKATLSPEALAKARVQGRKYSSALSLCPLGGMKLGLSCAITSAAGFGSISAL
jgi:hypothetical protein